MKMPTIDRIETVADNIKCCAIAKKLRLTSGLSLRNLGKRMGFTAPYLSDLELGRRNWRKEVFDKWVAATKQ